MTNYRRLFPWAAPALLAGVAVYLAAEPVEAASAAAPSFNGIWAREAHNYPKPYMAPGRGGGIRDGFNNEYLRAWVVEQLQRDDLVTRSGRPVSNPHSNCYPESVPAVF